MTTIAEIRLRNARLLLKEAGGQKGVIERTGRSQSQVSQLMGENAFKPIGGKIARSLERDFGKPVGWMDVDHGAHQGEEADLDAEFEALIKKTSPGKDLKAVKDFASRASREDAIQCIRFFLDRLESGA